MEYMHDSSLLWFSSYLSDRSQRVTINNEHSDWGGVSIGVPQGSILGPLLFSLYVNDLPSILVHTDISLYADDTEIHMSSDNINILQSSVQSDLDAIGKWMYSNRLCVT